MHKPHTHIYLSVDIHLVFSHILAKLNNTALNVYIHLFIWHMLSFLLGTYLEVGILRHMVILCLKYEKISNNFPKFHIPIRKVWVFKFFDTLSTHLIMCLLDYCHPSGYEMSSHSLVCIFVISSDAEHICHVLIDLCVFLMEKYLYRHFIHF